MIGEPADKSVKACDIHYSNSLIEELSGLGQDLRHGTGLELAQLNHDGAVGNLQILRVGQTEDLTKHHLHNNVLQWDLVLKWI